ncbi:tape measure protein [Endozoicomonas sp. ALB091]|uniref:tape measure protein n=1 Tax=Endozoicomonas sp. ALB091 TaxID=3403073 RepID=UPI003BB706A9
MANIKQSAIRLILKAKDLLSKDVNKSSASLDAFRQEANKLKGQLEELENQNKLLSSFKKQAKTTHDASRAFREAEDKVARLGREMGKIDKPTKAMQTAMAKARKDVKKANTEYNRQREALAKLRGSMSSAGLSTKNLKQQQAKLEQQLNETRTAFKRADESARQTARTLRNSNLKRTAKDAESASTSVGKLTRRFLGLAAATTGLYALKRSIEGVLKAGDQFERLSVQMEAITGSAEGAQEATQWIKDFTRNTPYQLNEVSEAFVRLKAFGLDPMDGTMQALVDQASKLGGGMDRLNGISLAVGQAWAKQKLQGEEILQMVERGIPVWDLLQKVTGKNVQELQKLSSAGQIGRDVMRELILEIGRSSEGAAAKNMSLLSGYVSNLKDSWQQFAVEVAKSGALDYAKDTLAGIAAEIERMNGNGQLTELAKRISDAFVAMGETIKHAFAGASIDGFVTSIKSGFATITEAMAALRTAFDFTSSTVKGFFNAFTATVKGFTTVYTGLMYGIVRVWQEVADALGFDGIAEKLKGTTDFLGGLTKEFAKQTVEDAKDVRDALSGVYNGFADESKAAAKAAEDSAKTMTKSQKLLWQNFADELLQGQKKVKQATAETAQTVKSHFENAAVALSQVNAAETRTELASLGVALAEAFSLGTLSAQEYYEATEASRKKLQQFNKEANKTRESLKDVGDEAEEAGDKQEQSFENAQSISAALAGHYNAITAELMSMSSAAHDAFVAIQQGGSVDTTAAKGSIEDLKNELKATSAEISRLQNNQYQFDVTGISRWLNQTSTAAAYVKKQFLEQRIALEQLFESYEQGVINARSFVREAEDAAQTMNLLNQTDLDRLNNAIVSAKQNMASLGDSSRNTLNRLQDELDELQGRQSDIEQRRYQNQRDDLKAQHAEAIANGDQEAIRNITSALRISEQIYNERRRQANNERTKALKERQGSADLSTPRTISQTPQRIIRLEYPGGDVHVGVTPGDETKLLEALKNAGMRTV